MSLQKEITAFTINEIFDSGKYIIPIYQRNYAWKEGQIIQLIQDINDYSINSQTQNYYIGTLVVFERNLENENIFETIDGQQRLTTLNILFSVLKNEYNLKEDVLRFNKINLEFENRITSSNALELAFKGDFNSNLKYNTNIEEAYRIIKKELKNLFGNKENLNSNFEHFIHYLNKKVVLLRVKVPPQTDLNHYFEIMNNRGEQLEKHEVLKAKLLACFNKIADKTERDKTKYIFNLIWEGCSQMGNYIQYGFDKGDRAKIFGQQWDQLMLSKFDELLPIVTINTKIASDELLTESNLLGYNIDEIIVDKNFDKNLSDLNEDSEIFGSVINFQNFILQCLLVLKKDFSISLDDKKLISNFDFLKQFTDAEQIEFVKEFSFTLLKLKFLFDQYVIKREVVKNKESWSLKRLFYYNDKSQSYINTLTKEKLEDNFTEVDETHDIILLQSMLHTVAPNMMYKYWLNACLNYLNNIYSKKTINQLSYKNYLFNFSKQLVFNRFLSADPKDYFKIIYSADSTIDIEKIDWSKLSYDRIENNLVFNFIDYLLLKEKNYSNEIKGYNKFAQEFEFTFRSSVEHYYPQNPKDGFDRLDERYLHSIGNLSLISQSKNSAMNNYMPKAKKEHYKNGAIADSVKQYIMFNRYPDLTWGIKEIIQHESEIINLLKEQL